MPSGFFMVENSIMETVYIPRNDTPAESRATHNLLPADQLPPYSFVRFPLEAAIDAPSREQRRDGATSPGYVFHTQVQRQVKRLRYQFMREPQGRKETFPLDLSCDYLANAENNVFRSWAAAGICPPAWGTPWPSGTERWPRKAVPGGPRIGEYWPHEEYVGPAHGLDLTASRPLRVFQLQWDEEFRWCRDEAEFQGHDIDEQQLWHQSFFAIKECWIEQKIWDPLWSEHPGDRWMHEDREDEIEEHAAGGPPPTYDELFGPQLDSDPQNTVEHSEASTSTPLETTSTPHTPPQTRSTKSTRTRAHSTPRRSARIAALNSPRAATAGVSKTSQRATARARPSRPCTRRR